jgi:hypothetical protein
VSAATARPNATMLSSTPGARLRSILA